MAKKNKKIKDPNKKSKAPYIMLPISMLIAGVVKAVIGLVGVLVVTILYGEVLCEIPGFSDSWFNVLYNSILLFADIASIIVILLFGLFNKGFTKKLQFVSSAFAGCITYMFVFNTFWLTDLLDELTYQLPYDMRDFMEVVSVIVPIVITILNYVVCFVISVVIAEFIFKALTAYTEAPKVEGEKSFKLKKMIVPAFLISGTAAIYPVFYFIEDIIYENIGFESYFISSLFSNAWYFAGRLLGLGILLGSIFILKDKYRALTCLAAASTGVLLFPQSISSTLGNIPIAISEGMGGDFYWLLTYILWSMAVAFVGIIFYILLNRKEMKRD